MCPSYSETLSSALQSALHGIDTTQLILLSIAAIFVLVTFLIFLIKSRKDLLRGDSVEIVMAYFFAFLSITGIAQPSSVLPFTLALLAVLSVAILKNRNLLEKVERDLSDSQGVFTQKFDEYEVNRNIEQAKQIMFLGTNLKSVTHVQYSRIEDSLRRGNQIQILMIESKSSLCDLAAKRDYEQTSGEEILKELNISMQRCKNLYLMARETKGTLEIRFLDFLPPFGGILIDSQDDRNGKLYLWFYTYRTKNTTKPKVTLNAMDGQWYHLFKEEIFALWRDATIYRGE